MMVCLQAAMVPPHSVEQRPDEISDGADLVVGMQDEHADMQWGAHQT
jgi:hypothetical protein